MPAVETEKLVIPRKVPSEESWAGLICEGKPIAVQLRFIVDRFFFRQPCDHEELVARSNIYNTLIICRLVLTWFPNPPQVIVEPLRYAPGQRPREKSTRIPSVCPLHVSHLFRSDAWYTASAKLFARVDSARGARLGGNSMREIPMQEVASKRCIKSASNEYHASNPLYITQCNNT
eukprot:1187776-Prorocentrum_minimum.AAC.8